MRKRRLLVLGCLTLCLALAAWADPPPNRTLLRKDTRYQGAPGREQFPEADSLILYDDIGFQVEADGTTQYREHDVVKLLTSDGVEEQGKLQRVYRLGSSVIKVEEARTILPDGSVVDLPGGSVSDEPLLPDSKLYADYRRFQLEFPQLVPDSLVEFVLITRRQPVAERAWWATSFVQNPDPILKSLFTVQTPADTPVHWSAPGLGQPRTREFEGGAQELHWEVSSLQPLRSEPAAPQAEDLLQRIDVSSFGSWSEMGQWFQSAWRRTVVSDTRVRMTASGLIPSGATPEAKAQAILDWVARSKRQLDLSFEQTLPNAPGAMIDEPVLSTLDTAALLACMLEFSGQKVYPVLAFSQPASELDRQVARPSQVGRVLLVLPELGGGRWVDPAHPSTLLTSAPGGFQGRAALILDGGDLRLADTEIESYDANRQDTRVEARIDTDGSAELAIRTEQYGAGAVFLREASRLLQDSDKTRREQILRALFSSLAQSYSPLAQVHDRYFPSSWQGEGFPLGATLIVPDFASASGDTVQAPVPLQLDSRIAGLTAVPSDRRYPVQFDHPFRDDAQVHLLLPPGSQVISVPRSVQVDNPYVGFVMTVRQQGTDLWFYSRLVVKKAWIPLDAYPEVLTVAREVAQVATSPVVYRLPSGSPGEVK